MRPDDTLHPDDELALIAAGEAADVDVARHVAVCARCTAELAALREVVHLVRAPAVPLTAPSDDVWDAVTRELDGPPVEAPAPVTPLRSRPAPEAPPAAVAPGAPPRRRISPWWLGAAAAAGLVVGGLGVGALDRPEPVPSPVVLGRATLDTLDTRQARGAASAVRLGGQVDLDVDTGRLDPGTGYLEVWLINSDLKRMVSVGVLRPEEGTQRFAIDQDLIDEGYVIVDVSREGFDDKPEHSGDSLVRGTLAL